MITTINEFRKIFESNNFIPEDEAREIISQFTHYKSGDKYYPRTQWAEWFLSSARKSKKYIVREIKSNPKLHNAMLSLFYSLYVKEIGFNGTYEQFLNTNITLYRGLTMGDKNNSFDEAFVAYTISNTRAQSHTRGTDEVVEIKIKPKDTYGAIQWVGFEVEVLVPIPMSEKSLEEEFYLLINNHGKYFDNDEHLYDLSRNKKYEEAIEYIKSVIKKNNVNDNNN